MARRFLFFARPYLPGYLGGLVLLLLTNGLALWIPWLLRDAIRAMERQADLRVVTGIAASIAGVAVLQALARTASRWTILGSSRRIVCDIRNYFFAQLQRLGASFYDNHRTGDVMSRGVNDVQLLQSFYGPGVLNLLNTAIVYVATVVLLFRIDVRLTVVSLCVYPPLLFAVNRMSRRVYARSLAVQHQLGEISSRAQENISGIQQVKTYVQEDREIAAFRELGAEYRKRNLSMAAVRGGMVALIGVVTGVGTLVVLYVGGGYVIDGRIDFANFVAFNVYQGMLAWPTIALGWIINVFQRGAGAMSRIDEILLARPDVPPVTDEMDAAANDGVDAPVDGAIEIRGLSFEYRAPVRSERGSADRIPALHDVTMTIPQGSRTAFVGPVGSGKSTLANLLARVYPVPRGTILIGGTDINDIPVSRVRQSIGYVPQEAFLFSRSLRDNVALGRAGVSSSEIADAVRVARLAADLEAFPDGLDTIIGERGYTLSGGQRQRATLARAVIADPRILILDDSLSAVDADTEKAILDELDLVMEGRTSILITHRLTALVGMDRIVVLDGGRLVEQGSHDELLELGGTYASLFRRQRLQADLEGR